MIVPKLNEFDSLVFSKVIGNIDDYNYPHDIDEKDFEYITVKCFPSNIESIHKLEDLGYRFLDISLSYVTCLPLYTPEYISERTRKATEKDFKVLFDISDSSFSLSKYHKDPNLSYESAQRLYRLWIKNSIEGTYGDGVLVYEDYNKNVLGFTSYRFSKDYHLSAYIDLTATFPNITKDTISVGEELLKSCLWTLYRKGKSIIITSTQPSNYSSISLLGKVGFKYQTAFVTFSKEIKHG